LKTGATRCQILRLKFTKFAFRWSSAPDLTGELTTLQTPWLYLRGRQGRGKEGKVKGRGGRGRDGPVK